MERTVVMLKLKSDEGEVRATSKRVLHNKAEIRQEGCYMRSASPKCTSWNPEKPVLSQTMSIPTRRKSVNDFHKGQAHDSSYSMFFGLGGLTTVEPNYEDCSITGYSGFQPGLIAGNVNGKTYRPSVEKAQAHVSTHPIIN
eukprot:Platyproteum_vivax@DN3753_c0_g1_i1.p1